MGVICRDSFSYVDKPGSPKDNASEDQGPSQERPQVKEAQRFIGSLLRGANIHEEILLASGCQERDSRAVIVGTLLLVAGTLIWAYGDLLPGAFPVRPPVPHRPVVLGERRYAACREDAQRDQEIGHCGA